MHQQEPEQVDFRLETAIEEIKLLFPHDVDWNITVRNEHFDPTDFRISKLCYAPEWRIGYLVIDMTVDSDRIFRLV